MKKLSAILPALQLPYRLTGTDVEISHITYDSRQVKPGSLFVAIKGFNSDGHEHIKDAIKLGAVALVVDHDVMPEFTQIIVHDTRSALSELSYEYYGCDYNNFELTGITGTNGKTTMTHLLYQIAEKAGMTPALIGTLGIRTKDGLLEGERTTPESADLAKIFYDLDKQGVSTLFMEVSSHAIALQRVHGLRFDAAVFTNLTQDHLDFHPSMEDYFETKAKLFENMKSGARAIINIDDPYGRRLYKELEIGKIAYAVENDKADYYFKELDISVKGINGILRTPKGDFNIIASLLGKFNAENIAGSIATWEQLYPETEINFNDLHLKPVSGRMEMIATHKATAVIDYAHTPDAMEKALKTASDLSDRKDIITVFGCGGDRDKAKRPIMGKIAEKYSNKIILTNDNPRNEDPQTIINEILEGFENKKKVEICIDREKAITNAWNGSKPGDILMILGKGAETYMEIKGHKLPFNDKEIMLKLEQKK
ncbi:MAG: UDP-N-acetylmuramoyl-L-alanyl-D-glutamate--2,6-diaminopimelate ligase [Candidatus Marinimicrobia bacterium]|nr:UDP-N-acetylmuramoyl-L-alanyl-D-glutamate--2,6-diaminopimelate ligase [Candidatus Neomarinimicrobiota bacterium]